MIGRRIGHYPIAGAHLAPVVWVWCIARVMKGSSATWRSRSCHPRCWPTRRRAAVFEKEALALSALNHPNIQTVHDFDTQDGVDFLVTV